MYNALTYDVMECYLTHVRQENSYWLYYIENEGFMW